MIVVILLIGIAAIWLVFNYGSKSWKPPQGNFSEQWRNTLNQSVTFYKKLPSKEKELFEYKVHEFLHNVQITGIETDLSDKDRLLIAASAVIPIFAFPEWKYKNLDEVLLYPNTFNLNYDTEGKDRNILGMVGTGAMERKMILSKRALHLGFKNETDKKNTAIHEFIHLIDKADGQVDGIPAALLERQYVIPWVDMIERKIELILAQKSDINPYGGTSRIEFFAVISEYFFERPRLLKRKHPKLYEILCEIFEQDLATTLQRSKD